MALFQIYPTLLGNLATFVDLFQESTLYISGSTPFYQLYFFVPNSKDGLSIVIFETNSQFLCQNFQLLGIFNSKFDHFSQNQAFIRYDSNSYLGRIFFRWLFPRKIFAKLPK